MSGFKVGQRYRKNNLSFTPGGCTIEVDFHNGKRYEYDKIKYPREYIKKLYRNPEVKNARVKN